MKKYVVRDFETEIFDTREEAVECLKAFEEQDIEEGIYTPGFYEIAECEL